MKHVHGHRSIESVCSMIASMSIIMDSKMSAKAVFNVWSSEPDTLKILDVRSPEDFRAAHVPTSEHIELVDVVNFILKQDNKIILNIFFSNDFLPKLFL